jgi:hypothetical protein
VMQRRVQAALSTQVAQACVPAAHHIHVLHALPRLPSGKLDVSQLLATACDAGIGRSSASSSSPARSSSTTVDMLRRLIVQSLGLPEGAMLGPDASFFAHGGDSLTAVKLLSAIQAATGTQLTFDVLTQHPSAQLLAAKLLAPTAMFDGSDSGGLTHRDAADAGQSAGAPSVSVSSMLVSPIVGADAFDDSSKQDVLCVSRGGVSVRWSRHNRRWTAAVGGSRVPGVATHIGCADSALAVVWKARLGKCVDASPLFVSWMPEQDIASGVAVDDSGPRKRHKSCRDARPPLCFVGSHSHIVLAVRVHDGAVFWSTEVRVRVLPHVGQVNSCTRCRGSLSL